MNKHILGLILVTFLCIGGETAITYGQENNQSEAIITQETRVKSGWIKEYNGCWYYYKDGISLKGQWIKDNGKWYYVKSDGKMQTGWLKSNNKWYYLKLNGSMQTGWIKDNNSWYYLKLDGSMQTGWLELNNKWYYLYGNGKMAYNTIINGNGINSSGVWVENKYRNFQLQVLELVNQERVKVGLNKLKLNEDLSCVATIKSQNMADLNYFDHTSPTYGSPFDMMDTFNIGYWTAGENIAAGYSTPESVMIGWMNSPGHKANILNPGYTEIGIGISNKESSSYGIYWTQMFIGN